MKVVATVAVLTLAGLGGLTAAPAVTSNGSEGEAAQTVVATPDDYVEPGTPELWSQPVKPYTVLEQVAAQRAAEAQAQLEAAKAAKAAEAARIAAEKKAAAEATKKKAAEEAARKAAAASAAATKSSSSSASTSGSAPATGGIYAQLDRLAKCESGGNPLAVSRTGKYLGAFQFSLATWRGIGMTGSPLDFSYDEQREAARRLQARSGWGQWPVCSIKVGLR